MSDAMDERDDDRVQLCVFTFGRDEYALDVMRVSSILMPVRVNPVPNVSPLIEGVISLRGSIIPVVDLRKRLGAAPAAPGPKSRMIIATAAGRVVAITVDRVIEVMRVSRRSVRPVPALVGSGKAPYLLGVCEARTSTGSTLRMLLNLRAFLEEGEWPATDRAEAT